MNLAALAAPTEDQHRARNLARINAWVAAMRTTALTKDDPAAFRLEWCDWLGRRMDALAGDDSPPFLRGLTAFDLAEAQIALMKA